MWKNRAQTHEMWRRENKLIEVGGVEWRDNEVIVFPLQNDLREGVSAIMKPGRIAGLECD